MAYKLVILPEAYISEAFTYLAERAPEGVKLGLELRRLLSGKRLGIYRIVFRIVEDVQEVHFLTGLCCMNRY